MIDVYEGNGPIDWQRVYNDGVRRAYIKLSEGTDHLDARCKHNLRDARLLGIQVGVYHYAGSSNAHVLRSPVAEARFFLRNALANGAFKPGDLPPALDLEETYGHPWAFLNDWKAQWFAAVDAEVGCRAAFYSYYYFWKQMTLYPDRPVWGAALGATFVPPPTWAIHQYSFTGTVPGITGHVDLDRVLWEPKTIGGADGSATS